MKSKGIVFVAPGVSEIEELEVKSPEAGEVLVKLVRSTVSAGTERANLLGMPNTGASSTTHGYPIRIGYSGAGVVEAVGEGVERVKVGDRVLCVWGKHTQYLIYKEKNVYLLDDSIGFDEAALVHIATFPMAAIRKCRLEMGESAMVMGLGVLGLMAIQELRVAGALPIIAVDPVAEKRARALELGADYALDPFAADFAETVKEITGGGAKVCIEVTGVGKGLDMALDAMARFGRIALLGCTRNSDFTIDYYRKVHFRGVTMVGAHTDARPRQESAPGWWTEADDERAVLEMLSYRRLDLRTLIEEVHPARDMVKIYNRLAVEKAFPVVQFDWTQMD